MDLGSSAAKASVHWHKNGGATAIKHGGIIIEVIIVGSKTC